jgi:hypothetical protein
MPECHPETLTCHRSLSAVGLQTPWMTLGQMRKNGGRMVEATCLACGHRDAVIVDSLPDEMPIPYVADKLRCSECRSKKIHTKANLWADSRGWRLAKS